MPNIPKPFADLISAINKKATVLSVQQIHPQLKKIVMQSDGFIGKRCEPGAQIEPRVSDTEFRHYNPSAFDATTGVCEMLIYLHHKGPGSKWAEAVKPGETIYLMGPGNKITLDTTQKKIVLLGDETAIGTFLFMQNGLGKNQHLTGAIETEKHLTQMPVTAGLQLEVVTRTGNNGKALLTWLQQNLEHHRNAKFYLLGNGDSNTQLRSYLKDNGIGNAQIVISAYWKEGKTGL